MVIWKADLWMMAIFTCQAKFVTCTANSFAVANEIHGKIRNTRNYCRTHLCETWLCSYPKIFNFWLMRLLRCYFQNRSPLLPATMVQQENQNKVSTISTTITCINFSFSALKDLDQKIFLTKPIPKYRKEKHFPMR